MATKRFGAGLLVVLLLGVLVAACGGGKGAVSSVKAGKGLYDDAVAALPTVAGRVDPGAASDEALKSSVDQHIQGVAAKESAVGQAAGEAEARDALVALCEAVDLVELRKADSLE